MANTIIKTVKTDNFEMNYFTFGTGKKTVVILPGASLKSVMLSADIVASAYDCFSKDYTVYLFDIKKDIEEGYTVSDMADDTAKAMEILKLDNAYFLGCSLGGMIAQQIAIKYPHLVSKLVLGSTIARQNSASKETCNKWIEYSEKGDICALNRDIWQRVYSKEYYEQYRDIFASLENDGTEKEIKRFNIIAKACSLFNSYGELEKITCPVLVIGSWKDNTLSGEGSVDIAKKLCCDLYMYSAYSHAVYDEAPDYKKRILNFFDE